MSVPQRWRLRGRVLSWGRLTEAMQSPCQAQPLDNVWIPPVPHGLASLRQDTSRDGVGGGILKDKVHSCGRGYPPEARGSWEGQSRQPGMKAT